MRKGIHFVWTVYYGRPSELFFARFYRFKMVLTNPVQIYTTLFWSELVRCESQRDDFCSEVYQKLFFISFFEKNEIFNHIYNINQKSIAYLQFGEKWLQFLYHIIRKYYISCITVFLAFTAEKNTHLKDDMLLHM